jgi:CBS domain-containing protein
MKAKDVMTPLVDYIGPNDLLEKFVEKLRTARNRNISSSPKALPVLDEQRKLLGMISINDILKAVYPQYLYETDLSLFTWDGMLESLAGKIADKKISDLMTTNVITVTDTHPLMECVDHILKHDISTLPVLDHDGNLVGMLYESQIFFAITDAVFGIKKGK